MGKWVLWLLVFGYALRSLAADHATSGHLSVEQLERVLSAARGKRDGEVAKQLLAIELTQRLSSTKLRQLSAGLPGEKSQQALLALADVSAFLDPPPDEIPATAAPDSAAQRQMLARSVGYLARTLPLLPNLFATRDIIRFESRPSAVDGDVSVDESWRAAGRSAVTVFYRDGHEYVDAAATKNTKAQTPDRGLATWGEFGPILGTVVIDAAQNRLTWSHWELSAAGPQAVFRYAVPVERSHYEVRFCCVTQHYGLETNYLIQRVGYHGEITVDPDSGTILRLTVIADPAAGSTITEASLLVEYGPVDVGGEIYFCPARGIALALSPDLKSLSSSVSQLSATPAAGKLPPLQKTNVTTLATGPHQYLLNDISFRQFHLFRSSSRIVSGNEAKAESGPASASPSGEVPPSPGTAVPAEEAAAAELASTAHAAAEPASLSPADVPGAPPAEPVLPEISMTAATGLPDAPAVAATGGTDSSFTLRLNARLVDVSLVALDKKGRPITNLKPEDLEIFDNGNKVDLRNFSQAAGVKSPEPAPSSTSSVASGAASSAASSAASGEAGFSNRAPVQPSSGGAQEHTVILLIDNNLSFSDLSNIREQMGSFLKALHGNERVAIYVMRGGGFQVLEETTTDHALLAATLAKWTPSSDSIALGQEQEARNRQQMEYVHNTEDLLSVNGRSTPDAQSQSQGQDPQLRGLGDNPGAKSLAVLLLVAHHLGAVPGHKSLVWMASDNVLADWTNTPLNIDKGSHNIEPAALRTQEAMNDAHVTVYPLDVSRLEAGGLDASIADRNVGLNPTATANQMGGGCGSATSGRTGQAAGSDPALDAGGDISTCTNDLHPGRLTAQMQQDLHSIQGVYREIADATGGRTFRRASDIVTELNGVVADGRATYFISFTPAQAADDKYHIISIKVAGRKDVTLRYRTGYLYRQGPTTIKDRFRELALQPEDGTEIGLNANLVSASKGRSVKLDIAATDLALAQKDAFWTDKLDIFLVQSELSGMKAHVTGQSMVLRLRSGSYQKYLREGITFNQELEAAPGTNSMRIIVVDENSGRMGSITIPVDALGKTS